jgi:hypothetical protein
MNNTKIKLKIGEFSKLNMVTVKTLPFMITDKPRFCYIDGIWNKDSESE